MPRPSRFSRQDLVDAAISVAARAGPAGLTMTAVAAATNAPTGSLYHRFASRDELLAEAWIRAMGSFQEGFLRALTVAARPPRLAASPFPIQWARGNLSAPRILVLHRRQEFIAPELPTPLRATAPTQGSNPDLAIAGVAMSAWGDSG